VGSTGVGHLAGQLGALAADVDPARDLGPVRAGLDAQVRDQPVDDRVILTLAEADRRAGPVGQQVGPVARDVAQLGHGRRLLVRRERPEPGVPGHGAGQRGVEQAVSFGHAAILGHQFETF
jgi:hypothetical protein